MVVLQMENTVFVHPESWLWKWSLSRPGAAEGIEVRKEEGEKPSVFSLLSCPIYYP